MTTIACDGKTMAADSRRCFGDMRFDDTPKIFRLRDGSILGVCGTLQLAMMRMDWLNNRGKPEDYPAAKGDDSCDMLVLRPDGKIEHYLEYSTPIEVKAPIALGSGREFAMGALLAGKNAAEAVEIACQIDVYSGGPIQVRTL